MAKGLGQHSKDRLLFEPMLDIFRSCRGARTRLFTIVENENIGLGRFGLTLRRCGEACPRGDGRFSGR